METPMSSLNRSIRSGIVLKAEDQSVRGPVDGLTWLLRVIDNMVWTDSWSSIAGVGCSLIHVGAGEERARKVLALQGLKGVERQVGSA
jgi:hypothetical protein